MKKLVLLFGGVFFSLILRVESNESASFLRVNPSVRQAGLGGNQAAAAGSLDGVFANPAGLSALSVPQLWATHNQSFIDSNYETLGFGLPLNERNAGSIVGQFIDDGHVDRIGIDPSTNQPIEGMGGFRPSTVFTQFSWSHKTPYRLSLGISAKGWSETLDRTTHRGWAADAGLFVNSLWGRWDFGLTRRNQGPRFNGHPLPSTWNLGTSYRVNRNSSHPLSVLADYENADNGTDPLHVGLEFNLKPFTVRAGVQDALSSNSKQLGQLTAGAGFQFRGWNLDYAWRDAGDLQDQQQISLILNFGLTPEEKQTAARQLDDAMLSRMKARAQEHAVAAANALEKRDWDSAIAGYRTAATWDPSNPDFQEKLIVAQSKKSEQENREVAPQKERVPPPPVKKKDYSDERLVDSLSRNAYTYYTSGNIPEAISTWKKVLALDPGNKDAAWALSEIQTRGGKTEQDTSFGKARRVQELNVQGFQEYSEGRLKNALKLWTAALAMDPHNMKIKSNIERVQNEISIGGGQP